jgi:hypothetical protein
MYVIEKTKDIIIDAKYYSSRSGSLGKGFCTGIEGGDTFDSMEEAILEIHNIYNDMPHLKGKLIVTKI